MNDLTTLSPIEQDKIRYARLLYSHGAPVEGMADNLRVGRRGTPDLSYDRRVLLATRAAYDIEGWAADAWEEATAGPMRKWFRVLRDKPADGASEDYLDWCFDAAEAWAALAEALAAAAFYREHAEAKRVKRAGVPFQWVPLTGWRN